MADEPDKDDRTEEPTQRKLDQAVEKGDVPRSQEIGTFFVLCGFTLALLIAAGAPS
jgi:flagellar biosynthetic protein FlhB